MKFLPKTGLVCVVAVLAVTSALPSAKRNEFIKGILESEETEGYDVATLYAVDSHTNQETGQSKQDIQNHATDLSTNDRTYCLQLSSGQQLRMSVSRHSIDTSGATFTELTEEGQRETIDVDVSECFFSGPLENAEGFASLSLCDGEMVGSISTPNRDYQIHALPRPEDVRESPDDVMLVLVTWQETDEQSDDVIDSVDIPEDSVSLLEEFDTQKRSLADHKATIEICDVVDKYFVANVKRKLQISSNSKILELLITKWSGVAHILSNVSQVGWDLDLRLVKVDIMRSNPNWYTAMPNERMESRLSEICVPTVNWKCDHIALHTGATLGHIAGESWVDGLCLPSRRCSAVMTTSPGYRVEIHELGHNLGLQHDWEITRCREGSDPVRGFMGGNEYHFRECYKDVLADTLAKKRCIFTDAITNSSEIGKSLRVINFPAKQPSSVCWGGPNLYELYVTSARKSPKPELEKTPLSGSFFKVTGLGTKGHRAFVYEG